MSTALQSLPADDAKSAVSSADLRSAMGRFVTGVTILTCYVDGQLVGVTANSFHSVSLDPPLISFCLANRAMSLPAFRIATSYAVCVLASSQTALAMKFAQRGADKWSAVDFEHGHSGAPLIAGAIATFECVPETAVDAGDHVVFIGRVQRVMHHEGDPLVMHAGAWAQCLPLAAA